HRGNHLRIHHIYLLYLSTSFLWWQAVVDIIGVTSSTTLRNNSRCTGRPERACAMSTTPPSAARAARCTAQAPARDHGHPGGAHEKRHDPIDSPCYGMRGPPVPPLFASWPWLLHTGCSLEALDMTVQ